MSESNETGSKETLATDEKLKADLEKYRQMALDMGCDDARIVPISEVKLSIRAKLGDYFPRGIKWGTSYFTLPNWYMPWKNGKALVASYRYAIFAKLPFTKSPYGRGPIDFTGPNAQGALGSVIKYYGKDWQAEDVEYWKAVVERRRGEYYAGKAGNVSVAEVIEKEARKDGHPFAFFLRSGPCRFCMPKFGPHCVMLTTGICRNPGLARPCGTAANMGIDCRAMYADMGWQNWVQGWSVFPEDFPNGPIFPEPSQAVTVFID